MQDEDEQSCDSMLESKEEEEEEEDGSLPCLVVWSLADEGCRQWTLQGPHGSTLILVFLEARASKFLFPRISNGSCGTNFHIPPPVAVEGRWKSGPTTETAVT